MTPQALFIIAAVTGLYTFIFALMISSFVSYRRLPRDIRRAMSTSQRVLFLYGYRKATTGTTPLNRANLLLQTVRESTQELERVMADLDASVERRQDQIRETETALKALQNEQESLSNRVQILHDQNPQIAQVFAELVEEQFEASGRRSLIRQVAISAFFFVLGALLTVTVQLIFSR
ncbi:MAG: hypothetical protein Q7K03_04095 [Dehalococcoidia bacterium]|nr:hypothetical protein [Dehalococcoidia bacterium]